MIDDDEFRPAGAVLRFRGLWARRLCRLKTQAGLGFCGRRPALQNAGPARDRRQFGELPLAQNRQATNAGALLRYRASDLIAEGLDQPAKFLEARLMSDVVNVIELDANENGARHWLF